MGIKEFDEEKDDYKRYVNPLSAYDNDNVNVNRTSSPSKFVKKFVSENIKKDQNTFSFKYNKDRTVKDSVDNLFSQKKNISLSQKNGYFFNPNGKIYMSEKHKLVRENLTFSYEKIKKSFITMSEDKKYPRIYLPEPGFGLLEKPVTAGVKKKKKKTK